MGRPWLSHRHANLLFSILLRPHGMDVEDVFSLTMVLALATIYSIESFSPLSPGIKWPNDIYLGQKKLGGILTEVLARGRQVDYAVLGLGLNVNWRPENNGSLLYPTTSISAEYGRKVSREDLLLGILTRFESFYKEVLNGEFHDFHQRLNERAVFLGREVEVETAEEKVSGIAVRMDSKGALIVKNGEGVEQRVLCGDVRVKFPVNGYTP